jgi:hypothetical protein
MATDRQKLGELGERLVCQRSNCPRCKHPGTLRRLPTNFECADVICDFCGYLAQVKPARSKGLEEVPNEVLGAAWSAQHERMNAGIYFPLFLVLVTPRRECSCYYLAADLQSPEIFKERRPLSGTARRSGWQAFTFVLREKKDAFVRVF